MQMEAQLNREIGNVLCKRSRIEKMALLPSLKLRQSKWLNRKKLKSHLLKVELSGFSSNNSGSPGTDKLIQSNGQ